jgi:tetratricopeptide (TPR) repeat protein
VKISRPLVAVFCAILFSSASAQVSSKDNWIKLKTPNFTLVSNSGEKDARMVATKLEQFRTAFKAIFPTVRFTSSIPTNVVVFKSSSSYRPYKPKRGDGKADEWIAGYFQPGEDVNYITLSTEGENEQIFGTIFHEYVHSLLNTTFGKSQVPPWFNEGLAEYYQTFNIVEDQKVNLGNLQDGHLQLLQRTKLIPLKDFFEITNFSLHRNGNHSRSIFYAQAWALIHFLIQGNGGANVENLGKFLNQVMNKAEPEKAFTATFGSDYATMEKALKKYVEQRTFRGTTVTFKNKLIFDDEFKVSPINEAEANAYLGDLLYHTNEYSAADAHLQKALQLDSKLSVAHASLGLVKMRQRDFAAAKKHLETAIADDQKNHFAHFNYAYVLSRESMDDFGFVRGYPSDVSKKMRESLQRAIELNPEYSESYRMLAFVLMIGNENLDEAVKVLKKGMTYQPGNQQYELLMAQIYLRQEKFTEAKSIVDRLAKTAEDEQMRANAEQIANTIAQYNEAKKNSEVIVAVEGAPRLNKPIFVKRDSMSDEQFAKMERDREIRNLNQVIERLKDGEKRVVGSIEKISCVKEGVAYDVFADGGKIALTSPDFQSLDLTILHEGTNEVSVGCDADIKKELVVITYKPEGKGNTLTALNFVPADFRLMSAAEIASAPNIIVQGGPPSDLAKNAQLASEQMSELEKKRDQMMLQQMERSMRKPLEGETRLIGRIEKVECSSKDVSFVIRTPTAVIKLKAPAPSEMKIISYTPDAGGLSFGCGVSYPTLPAVVTYRANQDKKGKNAGELVALEFVPQAYQLPAEN